jgi:hypothetical protein
MFQQGVSSIVAAALVLAFALTRVGFAQTLQEIRTGFSVSGAGDSRGFFFHERALTWNLKE